MTEEERRIAALADELGQLRRTDDIRRFRRKLDKQTAQKVIRACPPLVRATVLLALTFGDDSRYRIGDSEIGVLSADEDAA